MKILGYMKKIILLIFAIVLLSSCSKNSPCSSDDDCKLVYSSCGCEAVKIGVSPSKLWRIAEPTCIFNKCSAYNVTATCFQNTCTRSDVIAEGLRDASICEEVSNKAKDWCYLNVGKETKDILICRKIYTQFLKDLCLSEAFKANMDESVCAEMEGLNFKDICYNKIFTAKGDEIGCEKIEQQHIKEECFLGVVMNNTRKNTQICDRIIQRRDYAAECYDKIAVENADESFCAKIDFYWYNKDECYRKVAAAKKDEKICEYISDNDTSTTNIKDWCYMGVANATKDMTPCENKFEGYEKETCYRFVEGK